MALCTLVREDERTTPLPVHPSFHGGDHGGKPPVMQTFGDNEDDLNALRLHLDLMLYVLSLFEHKEATLW